MPAKPSDQLSNLTKVELRDIWPHEATDFTSWLAEEGGLKLLSDEIGIDIELIRPEAPMGSFKVDILAREADGDRKIVIENQLGKTDHDHLGKIITYASGYDAEILIWLVREARNEHKQAVEWLNEHAEKLNIFIVEIQVWKIGDSPPAPKFNVVMQPNNWQKAMKKAGDSTDPSDTQIQRLTFWTRFNEFAQDQQTEIKLRKPASRHWCNLSIGSGEASLSLTIKSARKNIGCEIYIHNNSELYDELYGQKDAIISELKLQELGGKLTWHEPPQGKKKSKILLTKDVSEDGDFLRSEATWEKHHQWMLRAAEKFQQVFARRVQEFTRGSK